MGADWQPLPEEEQPQTQPPSMLRVKEVEAEPMEYPVLAAVEVMQPKPQPWWHFAASCLGTTFCHCFGLAGTMLLCPTSRGKAGAAAGFAFTTFKVALFALIALVLVSHVHVQGRFYPDEYKTEEACSEAQGVWGVPKQFDNDHHAEHHRHKLMKKWGHHWGEKADEKADEPRDDMDKDKKVEAVAEEEGEHHGHEHQHGHHGHGHEHQHGHHGHGHHGHGRHGHGHHGHGRHGHRDAHPNGVSNADSSSSSSSSSEMNVDEMLFGLALRRHKGAVGAAQPEEPRCLCPHLYFPKWDDKANAMVCMDTRRIWLSVALFFAACTALLSAGIGYYLNRARAEVQPSVVVVGQPEQVMV